jgi:hypothetical protein
MCANYVTLKKLPKTKQSPIGRKFAQSGHPGANPTSASYNASVVKFYSATNSIARF